MDITLFETNFFFLLYSSSREEFKGRLVFTEDINILNDFPLPISHNSRICTSAPIENGHDSPPKPTPSMGKELYESKPTLSHEENNENIENENNELIKMPQNDKSSKYNRFKVGNRIWKGKTFVRKNHKEANQSTSQHCHESEPGNN